MAEHEHDELELDYDAGDFWIQLVHGKMDDLPPTDNGDGADRGLSLTSSGNIPNGTLLTTLLFAYMGFHARLLENHQCSNPDCQLVSAHRRLHAMLEIALEQHAHLMEGCDEEPEADEDDEDEEAFG